MPEPHASAHLPADIVWSPRPTVGVEQEFQIVDTDTWDLSNRAEELITAVLDARPDLAPYVHAEYYQNCVELVTPVCASAVTAATAMSELYEIVAAHAARLGLALAPGGTHPFADPAAQILSEGPRNAEIARRDGPIVAREYQIFATHVHIGMRDGDTAIAYMNAVAGALPILIGLTANSPYWMGEDTEYASWRPALNGRVLLSGPTPTFESWEDYCTQFDELRAAGVVDGMNDVWWDVRPSHHGTVEVRIADSVLSPEVTEALVAILQSLAVRVERRLTENGVVEGTSATLLSVNTWATRRYGIDATVVSAPGRAVAFADAVDALVGGLAADAESIGATRGLTIAQQIARDGNGADHARAIANFYGSLPTVVAAQTAMMTDRSRSYVRAAGPERQIG